MTKFGCGHYLYMSNPFYVKCVININMPFKFIGFLFLLFILEIESFSNVMVIKKIIFFYLQIEANISLVFVKIEAFISYFYSQYLI